MTVINMYLRKASKLYKANPTKLKREIEKSTIGVGDINIISVTCNICTYKIIVNLEELSNNINLCEQSDICRTSHSTMKEYQMFSSAQGKFTERDYMLEY